jgi:hypothetical protein
MAREDRNPFVPRAQSRRRVGLMIGAAIVGAAAAIAIVTAAVAGNGNGSPGGQQPDAAPGGPIMLVPETLPPEMIAPELTGPDAFPEELALPPISTGTADWLTRLQMSMDNDPRFGTVAISEDRATVTITWHGEPSAELSSLIGEAPDELAVVIQQAAFVPDELNALVARTPRLIPDIQVAMAGMENDGSGIWIGILELPAGRSLADVGTAFAEALGRPDVPVRVELSGAVTPLPGKAP